MPPPRAEEDGSPGDTPLPPPLRRDSASRTTNQGVSGKDGGRPHLLRPRSVLGTSAAGSDRAVSHPAMRQLLIMASEYHGCDLDTFITILSGSISGLAATFAKQPIQRIKWIRQVHEGTAKSYYRILTDTVRHSHRPAPARVASGLYP